MIESLLESLTLEEVVVLAINYMTDLMTDQISRKIVPISSVIFATQVLNYMRINKDIKDVNKLFIHMELSSLYSFIAAQKEDSPEKTSEIFKKIKKIESLL